MIAAFFCEMALAAQGGVTPALWTGTEGGNRREYFGEQVEAAGDVNADGVPDLIAANQVPGAPNGTPEPVVRVISGLDGSVLHELRRAGEANRTAYYGASIGGMDDFDLDGFGDFFILDLNRVVGQGILGSLHVHSGRDGAEIYRLDSDATDELSHCFQVGDLDGDGRRDFAVAADTDLGANGLSDPGVVRAHSCGSGALLFRTEGPVEDSGFGRGAPTDDMDMDGVTDLLIGATAVPPAGGSYYGAIYVLSGATGSIFRTIRADVPKVRLGRELASVGDVDDDGIPDILNGDPDADLGTMRSAGVVLCISGATGSTIFRLDGESAYFHWGARVSGGFDYDGDGLHDFTVYSSHWSTGAFQPQGAVFVFDRHGVEIVRLTASTLYEEYATEALLTGDINQDGRSEIAFGSPGRTGAAGESAGAVEIFGAETWLNMRPLHLTAGQAGLSTFDVVMPVSAAGWNYLLLASAGPAGSFTRGITIPLTPDRLLLQFAARDYPTGMAHAGLSGTLDGSGRAQGFLAVPSRLTAGMAGRSLRFAAVAAPPGANLPALSSAAIELRIRP